LLLLGAQGKIHLRPPDVPSNLNFSKNLQHKIQLCKRLSIPFISHKGTGSFVEGQQNWLVKAVTYLNFTYDLIRYVIRLSVINYLIAYILYSDCHNRLRYTRLDSSLPFFKNVRFNSDKEGKKAEKRKLFSSEQ